MAWMKSIIEPKPSWFVRWKVVVLIGGVDKGTISIFGQAVF